MSGARVETLAVPLLTHKAHPANWNEQSFIRSGYRFWAAFQGWYQRGVLPESLLAQIPIGWRLDGRPSVDQLGHLCSIIPAWLHDSRPQTIAIMAPEAAEVEAVLRLGGRAMRLAEVAQIAKAELAEIRNSTSWRITAPLRAAVIAARRFASTLKLRPRRVATSGRTPVLGR
jgi:hypothetical protein